MNKKYIIKNGKHKIRCLPPLLANVCDFYDIEKHKDCQRRGLVRLDCGNRVLYS